MKQASNNMVLVEITPFIPPYLKGGYWNRESLSQGGMLKERALILRRNL